MPLSYKFPLTGVILAGGKSLRMKMPKCLIEIDQKRLIEILIEKVSEPFSQTFIVTNYPEDYFRFAIPLLGDIYKFKGPMAGIHVALKNSNYDLFAFACDMPFVKGEVIEFLAKKHMESKSDATVGKVGEKLYPLPGIYSKRILDYLEGLLKEDKLSMTKLLGEINSQVIDLANLDREGLSFININTQEELEKFLKGGKGCLD